MITFAYDESQGFEQYDIDPRVPIFISGVVYHDNGEELYSYPNSKNLGLESFRLIAYFRAVCRDAGIKEKDFPRALHSLESNNIKLKRKLLKSLPEYLRTGTYNGKDVLFLYEGKLYEEICNNIECHRTVGENRWRKESGRCFV